MNAVAAGFRADVENRIADTFGFGEKDVFLTGDAQSERVHQRILRIARLEADFAADSRDSKTVSIVADAANYPIEDAAILCGFFFRCVLARGDLAESSTAMGRAPMVKMSRRMPPTPVVAPWNGST